VIQFVSFIDQKCYNITGEPLNLPLVLSHLNPLLRELPRESVLAADAQQLCVPVTKNQMPPPPPVAPVVSDLDLKCYAITNSDGFPLPPLGLPLVLTHLNPVLQQMTEVPQEEQVVVQEPQQLCVPVRKLLPPPPLGG
jgi:hypothetical protein